MTYSHLSRLVVYHFDAIRNLSREFHKVLVRGVLVHIIVAILGALEFDYETMRMWAL
jgi:hypothetical protein